MNINQSISGSRTLDQLLQIVDTIRNNDSIEYCDGSKIKIGSEIVDISKVKNKICEIFKNLNKSRHKIQQEDYEKLNSLLFYLQDPKEDDLTVRRIFQDMFLDDPQIKAIQEKCRTSIEKFNRAAPSKYVAPRSLKVEDCQTIDSLRDLLLKMKLSENQVPRKDIEKRIFVLYKKNIAQNPEVKSRIAYDTFLAIHQLNLMQPKSIKNITGIEVLERKCIQSIREDKDFYNHIRNRYNRIAVEINDRNLSKYLFDKKPDPFDSITSIPQELFYLEKILYIENNLEYYNPEYSLIDPVFDVEDPKDIKKCMDLYYLTSVFSNYIDKVPKEIKESLNLHPRFEFQLKKLAWHCAETMNIPLTFDQKFGDEPLPPLQIPTSIRERIHTTSLLELPRTLSEANNIIQEINKYIEFKNLNKDGTVTTEKQWLVALSQVMFYGELLETGIPFDMEWNRTTPLPLISATCLPDPSEEELVASLATIPYDKREETMQSLPLSWRERIHEIQSQPPLPRENLSSISQFELINHDFLNEKVNEATNLIITDYGPIKRFVIFCNPTSMVLKFDLFKSHLKGVGRAHAVEFEKIVEKRVHKQVLHLIQAEFNTLKKVFDYVKTNYEPLEKLLGEELKFRKEVYAKLDELIEDQMLEELDSHPSSNVQNFFGSTMSSTQARAIRNHLEKIIEGVLDESQFRRALSNRDFSNKYMLRLACTALDLFKRIEWSYISDPDHEEIKVQEAKEQLKRYTEILWKARNNDFKSSEHMYDNHFRQLFINFYQFFITENTQDVFWNAILAMCNNLNDYQMALDLNQAFLDTLLERKKIDVNQWNLERTPFLKKFPMDKYLNLRNKRNASKDKTCLTMSILIFISHFKTQKISDLLLSNEILESSNKLALENILTQLETSGALSSEELKIFRDNYSAVDE